MEKGLADLESILTVYFKVKHTFTIWPSNILLSIDQDKWKHINFYINFHSNFTYSSQKQETSQVLINRRKEKQI